MAILRPLVSGLVVLCLLAGIGARAQSESPPRRPRIGLALAGGSALGLAHVGVLEWFERHRIPIDVVAGTSMGGLVGGCYSTGMSPEAMRQMLRAIDWNDALRASPAYTSLNFRRKEDSREVPSRFTVGLRDGFSLPAGLSPAHPVGLLLSQIALPYSEIASFDELPIPFRCVAVDLGTGTAVTMGDGSLATALRATMAIPGVFTPVVRDSRLLVDGGVLNNLPTEAVRQMGADIVIAVDLSQGFADAPPQDSLIGVLGRTIWVTVFANERRSLALADIVLAPKLTGLTPADFDRVDDFHARGFEAAGAQATALERLALPEAEWDAYVATRTARRRAATTTPTFVRAPTVSKDREAALQRQLAPLLNAPLDNDALDRSLRRITGTGRYEGFQYQRLRASGTEGLLLHPSEPRHGPPFLRLGLEVDGADTDNIQTDFVARYVGMDVGRVGTEVRGDLRLGSNRQALAELYRPLDPRGRWFAAPRLTYSDRNFDVFEAGKRIAIYGHRSVGAALDLGAALSPRSELRLGYRFTRDRAAVRTGSPSFATVEGDVRVARAQWIDDGHDSAVVPSRGSRTRAVAQWTFAAPGSGGAYPSLEVNWSRFVPAGRRDSLFGGLNVGSTLGHTAAPLEAFTLGGPMRLGAYSQGEFRGNDYVHATAGYLHRLLRLPALAGDKVMAGGWLEVGGASARFRDTRLRASVSVGILAETLAGPLILAVGFGEEGRRNLAFSIGRSF